MLVSMAPLVLAAGYLAKYKPPPQPISLSGNLPVVGHFSPGD
jgi:hypothetical protein